MSFHVYPDPHDSPIRLTPSGSADETHAPIAIDQLPAVVNSEDIPVTMFIRVAMSAASLPMTSGTDPGVFLQAGSGTEKLILLNGVTESIYDDPSETAASFVAAATMYTTEPNDVFRIEVTIFKTGTHTWNIRILNNHTADRDFVWVVGDIESETHQPWLDISSTTSPAGTLDYDALVGAQILIGQTENHTLQVANKGTGPLTINDAAGGTIGTDFVIVSVPSGDVDPNDTGDIVIAFNAPGTAGQSEETHLINSSDSLALADSMSFHNRQASLTATSGKLEVMMLLDTSGSMPYAPNGDDPPANPNESRWGRLKTAVNAYLDVLGARAVGRGRLGVSMFPDITQPGYPDPIAPEKSAADFHPPSDITAGDISGAKSSLDTHTPVKRAGATSMGRGIERVIGTFGMGHFEDSADSVQHNRRWLVIMSDGAHNSGPPDPQDFYKTAEGTTCPDPGNAADGRSFIDKGVRVLTVAYGDETGETTFEVDHDLLARLVCKSNGPATNALDAGINDVDPIDPLAKQFFNAIIEGLNLESESDPSGILTASAPEVRPQILITPYDSSVTFVVNWDTFDAERLRVELLTPGCDLITPELAAGDPNITYSSHPRYAIYTVHEDYLHNVADPANPRYGTWTLIISAVNLAGGDREPYEYLVMMDSRLKMKLTFDKSGYFTGDSIHLDAALTLDGKPIQDAAVNMRVTGPGQSPVNWLAKSLVTEAEFEHAAADLDDIDASKFGIKTHALHLKGRRFNPISRSYSIPLLDEDNDGIYRASFDATTVPGSYEFHITATGQTEEGTLFRRERQVHLRVKVRPLPEFTWVDVDYIQFIEEEHRIFEAIVKFFLEDPFGNVVLVDPDIDPEISLTAEGGDFTGPLVSNLDGSYSRTIRYPERERPAIGLQVGGREIISRQPLAEVTDMFFADRIVHFDLGLEGAEGANRHRDPQALLGNVTTKKAEEFTALGVSGSVIVGFGDQVIRAKGDDDFTVFVQPGQGLRRYKVEAQTVGGRGQWVKVGTSAGITQSFSLAQAGLPAAKAIRIMDQSATMLDIEGKPLDGPGVNLRGVGVNASALGPGDGIGCPAALAKLLARLFGGSSDLVAED